MASLESSSTPTKTERRGVPFGVVPVEAAEVQDVTAPPPQPGAMAESQAAEAVVEEEARTARPLAPEATEPLAQSTSLRASE